MTLNGHDDAFSIYYRSRFSDGSDATHFCSSDGFGNMYCRDVLIGPSYPSGEKPLFEREPVRMSENGEYTLSIEYPSAYEVTCYVTYFNEEKQTLPLENSSIQRIQGWKPFPQSHGVGPYTREFKDGKISLGEYEESDFAYLAISIVFEADTYGQGVTYFLLNYLAR